MRWIAKPLCGPADRTSKRTVRRFALFPRRVEDENGDDVIIWLESYWAIQEVRNGVYGGWEWHTIAKMADDPLITVGLVQQDIEDLRRMSGARR